MKRLYISLFAAFAALAMLVAGCGGSSPSTNQATAVPTTAPTSAAPAFAATPPPVPTLGPGRFTDAFKKMSTVSVYRLEISRTGTGLFSPLNGVSGPDATVTPAPAGSPATPDIAIKGAVNGKDSDLTLSGMMASFSGGDPNKGIEIITVGDKSYLHGPMPAMGATEDKWYEMPTGTASAIVPAVDPDTLFGSLTQTGLDPNAFSKTGTETLDNHSCDIYSGAKDITLKAFQDLFKNSQNSNFAIDTADSRFWLCDDGYVHQTALSIDAHQSDKPDQKGTFTLMMHVYDFNTTINIQAPTGAVPLQIPGINPTGPAGGTPESGTPAAGATPTP